MPPRRSTRTKASVEPESAERTNSSKRKRISPDENQAPADHEEEQTAKPASRARKASSTRNTPEPSSQRRVATRARRSLQDVHESEEEQQDEDSPPPVKKSRPSPENDDFGEDVEEDVKPSRTRRASARKASTASATRRQQKSAVKEEDAEIEEAELAAPGSRTRRSSVQPPARSRTVRAWRAKKSQKAEVEQSEDEFATAEAVEVPSDDEEGDEEEIKPRAKGRQSSAKKRVVKESDDDDSDFHEDAKPAPRTRRSTTAGSTRRGRSSSAQSSKPPSSARSRRGGKDKEATEQDEIPASVPYQSVHGDQEGDDLDALSYTEPRQRRKTTPPVRPDPIEEVEEEEEEERSLLEPEVVVPPSPAPKAQTQPAVIEEPQGPKSRLVIHQMALVNFKSYAGRQEIGPFHKSFSAIVGPNGSGKSNTIDALLFVFGYRASKMRQAKLSELIHNSARHPDLEECSVEVHFREIIDLPGPEGFEVVPDSQLVVTRTAYKNNSSKYTINGRQSNYKEVQALLKGRGIDLDHNRFLILQGEVESIAQMKPKAPSEHEDGLLEYLEDIIGTSKYKEPIDEALVEMEKFQEERNEKLNRLKIVERERNALEQQKKEAEDYLRLQNEHVRALSRLWQYYIWRSLLNEDEFSRKLERLEKELKDETERHQDDIEHVKALQEHYDERCAAYEEVRAAAAEAQKDLTAREKEQVRLEERRKHAKTRTKKLEKSLADDARAQDEASRAITDNTDKMKKQKKKLDEHETDLAREEKVLEEIRDSLKDKTQVFHDKIEAKQKELQPWTEQINRIQGDIDVATSERDALAKKAEELKNSVQEAESTLNQLRGDHEAKEAELGELEGTKEANRVAIANGRDNLQRMRVNLDELKNKAFTARQRFDEARKSQADNTTRSTVLEGLNKLRAQGRVDGFHGRLGSLGTIPDKYDIAVSTACPSLNHMVVDTVEQGQICIEHLRKQNLGRASFMVLDKIPSHGMDKIQTPENVPRLFDLIKPKHPRFAPAFYKAAHNTLVAEDMEQANRIAFGGSRRWRVVTLSGQLIEASGAMTGGGSTVYRGYMSSKLPSDAMSPAILRQLEEDSQAADQARDNAARELRETETELEALAQAGPSIDTAIQKIKLDLENANKRITELEKRVKELKAKSKPNSGDLARIAQLERSIAEASTELGRLEAATATIQGEIAALEKKILEIGGSRLLTQKSKVEGLRLHIQLANDELTKAEVAKAKAEKDVAKHAASIETAQTNLEDARGEMEVLDGEIAECVEYISAIRDQVGVAQEAAESAKEDLDGLKAQLDEKSDEIQAFRQREMELKQSISDTKQEATKNDGVLHHWQKEHDRLRLADVDDEDDEDEEGDGEGEPEADAEAEAGGGPPAGGPKPEPEEPTIKKSQTDARGLHMYSEAELSAFKRDELVADSELLDEKLKSAKPNLSVLRDYRKREEEFLRRAQDLDEVTRMRDAQKAEYEGLRTQRLNEFMAGFNMISLKLKEMYQMITLGGNAELELVDSMDPFAEGIIFSVMPPKKSWRNISNLSGGEKTLSSLALVFALHVYKPTPLYFMDEIDAALDFRNVSIVANYIKDRTKNAQFIIISLRNDMFELSHRLIGIYKTSNATRSISIDNHALHVVPSPAPRRARGAQRPRQSDVSIEAEVDDGVPA